MKSKAMPVVEQYARDCGYRIEWPEKDAPGHIVPCTHAGKHGSVAIRVLISIWEELRKASL